MRAPFPAGSDVKEPTEEAHADANDREGNSDQEHRRRNDRIADVTNPANGSRENGTDVRNETGESVSSSCFDILLPLRLNGCGSTESNRQQRITRPLCYLYTIPQNSGLELPNEHEKDPEGEGEQDQREDPDHRLSHEKTRNVI